MKMRNLMPYCLVVLLAGCGPIFSLHALYTKEAITFEEKLLGTWLVDPNKPGETWEFARLEESAAGCLPADLQDQAAKCYRVTLTDEKRKGSIVTCLVKLQGRLFLDLMPSQFPGGEENLESADSELNAVFFLRLHTFAQVSFSRDQLTIRLTDDDGFKDLLKAEPKAVEYTTVEERPLLTASTQELQAFVTKYADDKRLFTEGDPLTRKPSSVAK
jgi:hypothetical protein